MEYLRSSIALLKLYDVEKHETVEERDVQKQETNTFKSLTSEQFEY